MERSASAERCGAGVILTETETFVVDDSWLERARVDSPLPHDEFRCWPTDSWKSSKRLSPRATASLARSFRYAASHPRLLATGTSKSNSFSSRSHADRSRWTVRHLSCMRPA